MGPCASIFRPRPTRGRPAPSPRATWPARHCSSWPTTRKTASVLTALIEGPAAESYEVVGAGTVALIAAALVVLQTHVLFERDKDGKIRIKIEKKPTQVSLLKDLVQKLGGFSQQRP